jgi:hypothetical protein
MQALSPVMLIVFLLVIAGNRVWARRSLALLSVEQKARVIEATAAGNVWPAICLAFSVAALLWLPTGSIHPHYRAGVLWACAMVPFLLSVGAAISTLIRFSCLQLPERYLHSLRLRTIIFHLALLSVMSAVIYDIYSTYARLYDKPRQSSNPAMQRTAGLFGVSFAMTSTLYSQPRTSSPAVADLGSR